MRQRDRQIDRQIDNGVDDAGDVAYVVSSANHDATVIVANDAITAVVALDVDFADDPVLVADSGVSPSKAHEKRSRPQTPYTFGRIPTRMHCPFSRSSSFLLVDFAAIQRWQYLLSA